MLVFSYDCAIVQVFSYDCAVVLVFSYDCVIVLVFSYDCTGFFGFTVYVMWLVGGCNGGYQAGAS